MVLMDSLDLLVSLETEVKRAMLEREVLLVQQDRLAYKGLGDLQEILVLLEQLAHLELMD